MGFLNCLSKLVNCYASKMGYNGIIKVNVEKKCGCSTLVFSNECTTITRKCKCLENLYRKNWKKFNACAKSIATLLVQDCETKVNNISYKYTDIDYNTLEESKKQELKNQITLSFSKLLAIDSSLLNVVLSQGSVAVNIEVNGIVNDRPSNNEVNSAATEAADNANLPDAVENIEVLPCSLEWELVTNQNGDYSQVTLVDGQVVPLNLPLNSFFVFSIGDLSETTYFVAGVSEANFNPLSNKVIYSTNNGEDWIENSGASGEDYPVSAYDWVYFDGILYCAAFNGIFWATSPDYLARRVTYTLEGIDRSSDFIYRLGYDNIEDNVLFAVAGSRSRTDEILRIELSGVDFGVATIVANLGSGKFQQFLNVNNVNYAVLDRSNNAGSNIGGLYKSIDRGVNWNQILNVSNLIQVTIDPNNNDLMYLGLYEKIGRLNLQTEEWNENYIVDDLSRTNVTCFLPGNSPCQFLAGSSFPYTLELGENNGTATRQSNGLPQRSINYFGLGTDGKAYLVLRFNGAIYYRTINPI